MLSTKPFFYVIYKPGLCICTIVLCVCRLVQRKMLCVTRKSEMVADEPTCLVNSFIQLGLSKSSQNMNLKQNRKKMIFTCSVALDRCTVTDAHSHRWMSNQTDRQARIPFCSISCVRRRREQTADITSCWGQSHRNRPGASRSAVMAITTLSTAKNTHTPTHTVYTHTHKHTTALLLAPNCQ